jgi:two-component system, cell cycle sensor histidine kinase and response regulator CckA
MFEVGMGGYADSVDAVGRLAGKVALRLSELFAVVDRNTASMGEALEDGQLAGELQEMRDACVQALVLSNHLLSISGSRRAEPRVIDLRTLVSEMRLGHSISDDVLYCTDFAAEPCPVNADPAHLEELILGLVRNAKEAVGRCGTVRIAIDHLPAMKIDGSRKMGWVQLDVSDSGQGMDWETLTRAFHPFFTTRPDPEDRGLGLAVSCGIIRQNGGTMKIYSAPGCGTTVRVWLPAAASVSA